jgi:hypothetical protein
MSQEDRMTGMVIGVAFAVSVAAIIISIISMVR